jgi:Ankyrin repeat
MIGTACLLKHKQEYAICVIFFVSCLLAKRSSRCTQTAHCHAWLLSLKSLYASQTGQTALCHAAAHDRTEVVRLLIAVPGVDVNFANGVNSPEPSRCQLYMGKHFCTSVGVCVGVWLVGSLLSYATTLT